MAHAPFDREELVETFRQYDAGMNDGKGNSESPDSGRLGWGESGVLANYIKVYNATGDTAWLDKVVAHFDRMIASRTDLMGDGYTTWATPTYSVALIRTGRMHNRGTGRISPDEERVWMSRGGDVVCDVERTVEVDAGRRYRVLEYGARKLLAKGTYRAGAPLKAFLPFKVIIDGKPEPGDRFWVQTYAGEPLEYIVHQGMFLYPVAQFIELALKNRKLKAHYGEAARRYLDLIAREFAEKHERDWVNTTPSAGAYRFPPLRTDRFPNRILPHNQYLAMARAYLVLKNASRKRLFADRAERMARNFKRHLRRTGQAYTWHYWDWIEAGEPGHSGVEDTSHGNIDIGFAVEACRRGVVFKDADLKRFARTVLDQMWNGCLEDPVLGGRVDTREGDGRAVQGWIDLCQWNPKVWDVYWALFCKMDRPAGLAPTMLQGWARLQEGKGRK